LKSAEDGISAIAKALAAGELAPASGRVQVDDGLKAAQTALNTITSYANSNVYFNPQANMNITGLTAQLYPPSQTHKGRSQIP
jgi:hypothetical protein